MSANTKPAIKRLYIELDAEDHRELKTRAVVSGRSMRDLVISLLRREGLISPPQENATAQAV